MNTSNQSPIVIYQEAGQEVEVRLDVEQDTVWLTQRQMAELFGKDVRTINEHLMNVYSDGELERDPTIREFRIVRKEGAREVSRNIEHYNLDVIISVGYRVKSPQGIRFRQWATRILREHLTQGWTLNRQRFEENARELEAAMALVRKTAGSPAVWFHRAFADPDFKPGAFRPPADPSRELRELQAEMARPVRCWPWPPAPARPAPSSA